MLKEGMEPGSSIADSGWHCACFRSSTFKTSDCNTVFFLVSFMMTSSLG